MNREEQLIGASAQVSEVHVEELRRLLERKSALLALLEDITLEVSRADSLEALFGAVLVRIGRFMGWPLGHAYLWSAESHAYVSSRVWYAANGRDFDHFRRATEETCIPAGEGVAGRLAFPSTGLYVPDISLERDFQRRDPAWSAGLRSYYAFPVLDDSRPNPAVVEFFIDEVRPPDPETTELLSYIGRQLGQALHRYHVESALRASERRLAEAQRIAHVGYWESDLEHQSMLWSDEMYRIFGLDPAEEPITDARFLELIHPEDRARFVHEIRPQFTTQAGRKVTYHYRIVRPDGVERIVHAHGTAVMAHDGRIAKVIGTTQDVTEQKAAEDRLARSVAELSALDRMGQIISASLDVEAIYRELLARLRDLVGAESVLIFEQDKDDLVVAAADHAGLAELVGCRVPLEQWAAGEVWQTQQSQLLRGDACRQRISKQLVEAIDFVPAAMLAVPIRWQDEPLGVLEAIHRDAGAFGDDDMRVLEMAATWTAIALNNVRQHNALQRRLRESNALAVVSKALTQVMDLQETLDIIARLALDVVGTADAAVIHLVRGEPRRLYPVALAGLERQEGDLVRDLGVGYVGQVAVSGETLRIHDVQRDARRLPEHEQLEIRALLVAPVKGRGDPIGTITLHCPAAGAFSAEDERLVKILGVQAGFAVENALLYESQRRAREQAEAQGNRMALLARQVVTAQEDERRRLASELHDEAGQALTAIKMSLDFLRASLGPEQVALAEGLAEVSQLTNSTMQNLRRLSHNLRPPGLDLVGLSTALEGLCEEFGRYARLEIAYDGCEVPAVSDMTALSLYRFAQEALTNVAKHAQASKIQVQLSLEEATLSLSVSDDGKGFDLDRLNGGDLGGGRGLRGMRERLEMIGGSLSIRSAPGSGTLLRATVPQTREAARP